MSRQKALDLIEQERGELHRLVDARMDALILRMTVGDLTTTHLQNTGARVLPLNSAAAQCKGLKPAAVVLPSGERVETSTWKKAAAAILKDCGADPRRRQMLLELRGRVPGNFRQLLTGSPEGMDAPLKIGEGLYLESKFDAGALMKNLTEKILRRVGYDVGGVVILCRAPRQEAVMDGQEPDEGPVPPTGPAM